jgi:hypothetical protein
MADKTQIDFMLAQLTAAFPTEMSNETMAIYEKYLMDIPEDDLRFAVDEIIITSKFFPRVSEIRDKVNENQLRREGVPCSADAWAEVQREMKAKGIYHAPEFSHPLVREVMYAVGGWHHLNSAVSINMETVRAQYLRMYDGMISRLKQDIGLLPATKRWLGENEKPKALPETISALTRKMSAK